MSPTLEVTTNDFPTKTNDPNDHSLPSCITDDKRTSNKSDENNLNCGVVINKIICEDNGDNDQLQKPTQFSTNSISHSNLPAASFWTPQLSSVQDDEFVNYGSCVNNSLNKDEVDQMKQTFLDTDSNKLNNKDIESLFAGQSNYHPMDRNNSKVRWWKHPKFKENWKIFFTAFGLLVVGIGLIAMGILVSVLPDIDFQSYVFFIAGAICFIPGAYHVVFMYFALSGRKGYDFHQLPLFN